MFTACARPTPEQQVVDDAAAALGGAERLLAVRTVVIEGEGTHYNLGQDIAPGASGQTFAVTQYKRAIDVPGERARTELARVPKFNYWQGLARAAASAGHRQGSGIQRRPERCGKPRRAGGGR